MTLNTICLWYDNDAGRGRWCRFPKVARFGFPS